MEAIKTKCRECGRDLELTAEATGPLAQRLAQTFAERGVFCDPCGDAEQATSMKAERIQTYGNRLNASGLPEGLRRWTWKDWPNEPAVRAAKAWAEGGGGLALQGSVGVGKTCLAATAVSDALQRRRVRWVSVAGMMADLSRSFKDEERAAALDALTGEGAVVLDDLDKANTSNDRACEALFTAIDKRVAAGSPLLVTGNMGPRELTRKLGPDYGEPIVSRILGYCEYVVIDGDDRRTSG